MGSPTDRLVTLTTRLLAARAALAAAKEDRAGALKRAHHDDNDGTPARPATNAADIWAVAEVRAAALDAAIAANFLLLAAQEAKRDADYELEVAEVLTRRLLGRVK